MVSTRYFLEVCDDRYSKSTPSCCVTSTKASLSAVGEECSCALLNRVPTDNRANVATKIKHRIPEDGSFMEPKFPCLRPRLQSDRLPTSLLLLSFHLATGFRLCRSWSQFLARNASAGPNWRRNCRR